MSLGLMAQSPHGQELKMDCARCHTSDSWAIPFGTWNFQSANNGNDSLRFNHNIDTDFPIEGGHIATDCRLCHEDLVFTGANTECISCHTDLHNMTVGSDCARCHTVDNWLVDNITELHQENGFPLLGSHAQISCNECHVSETGLQFTRIGNECINCHLNDFLATTSPNHVEAGYSQECIDCHDINAFDWSSQNILHDFFPLVKGHDIDCIKCHTSGTFAAIPTDCISCHQQDFEVAQNPDHQALNFTTDCASCHTLDLNWMPARFQQHDDEYFPIYTGAHAGEWNECTDCHLNPANYSEFTCTTCHGRSETDDDHDGVGGYVYESNACLACHPTGSENDNFDHNRTNFPLTGAHISVDCKSCHANGFAGTPTDCAACHTTDFEQTKSPDHQNLGFSMDCARCHTTDPDWMPATFPDHDRYYVLRGAHAEIANNCAACHNSTFTNTPTTCFGCHQNDYLNAFDPNHVSANFPKDCTECHSEEAWEPADFDHDGMYFPIYSGTHKGAWTDCTECHTIPGNFTAFSCIDCHEHNDPNDLADEHDDVRDYRYESNACFACHPNGEE